MKIIIAQGNPGSKYSKNRHNIGFMAIDFLARYYEVDFNQKTKFSALTAEINIEGEKVLLVKPQTFYNQTGQTARALLDFYKLSADLDCLVIHDDLALDFGTLRTRSSGSDAGNNGIKSIISHIGGDFARIKIGIANQFLQYMDSADFVLSDLSKIETEKTPQIFEITHQFVLDFVKNKFENTKKTIS